MQIANKISINLYIPHKTIYVGDKHEVNLEGKLYS